MSSPTSPSRVSRHDVRRWTRSARVAALALTALAPACVTRPATSSSGDASPSPDSAAVAGAADAATTRGTVVALHQEGGFAGLVTDATVDGVARRFQTVTRHICGAEGGSCPAPIDSASGALPDSLATAVARAVEAADFFSLRADYGTDPRLRDGYVYVLTVHRGDRSATVRGDDVTRPPAAATLAGEVRRIIDAARGRR